ncbi:hypothetical protein FO499_27145 [Bacillus anthracis]|uniref:hypothetical protein n=1 Tax=Bacillus TaxID=1386 RepID=UPI0008FE884C|nr:MULTISPECIES: hypothetical protein [Bacillus]MBL3852432.1 hypothetical protein [Bacillus cereus]MDR4410060.1 hypothetical protein [Bacillus anthracis]OJE21770.1 hypothetical protein BAQ46_20750 [Bacillus paranthracis]TSI15285.1 hypothetical protein FOT98_12840 [Bacillus sp. HY001]
MVTYTVLETMPSLSSPEKAISYKNQCISEGMFAHVSLDWVKPLADWIGDKKCLEVLAGRGFLAKALSEQGVTVIASDDYSLFESDDCQEAGTRKKLNISKNLKPVFDIKKEDALTAIRNYGKDSSVLIISWPYEGPMAAAIVEEFYKVVSDPDNAGVIYIGEFGRESRTANDTFFEMMEWEEDDDDFEEASSNYTPFVYNKDSLNLGILNKDFRRR